MKIESKVFDKKKKKKKKKTKQKKKKKKKTFHEIYRRIKARTFFHTGADRQRSHMIL